MEKLTTIQVDHKLNDVFAVGPVGPGGARHCYSVNRVNPDSEVPGDTLLTINFQKGPRNDPDSIDGVLDGDLLEIVRDRLTAFQAGDFACVENSEALTHVEKALQWLNQRAVNRAKRGVLGTNQK